MQPFHDAWLFLKWFAEGAVLGLLLVAGFYLSILLLGLAAQYRLAAVVVVLVVLVIVVRRRTTQ